MLGQEVIGAILNLHFQLCAQPSAAKATSSREHTVVRDGVLGLGFTSPTGLPLLLL